MRAVEHDDAAGRKRPGPSRRDIRRLAVRESEDARQVPSLVEADMQFDPALRAWKRPPREDRQAQVDGRRVQRMQRVPETGN